MPLEPGVGPCHPLCEHIPEDKALKSWEILLQRFITTFLKKSLTYPGRQNITQIMSGHIFEDYVKNLFHRQSLQKKKPLTCLQCKFRKAAAVACIYLSNIIPQLWPLNKCQDLIYINHRTPLWYTNSFPMK